MTTVIAKSSKRPQVVRHPSDSESILSHIANLCCERGHKHFSPEPMSWVGSYCGAKRPNGQKCKKPLMFMRHSRDIPVPKPKVKRSKLLRIRRT